MSGGVPTGPWCAGVVSSRTPRRAYPLHQTPLLATSIVRWFVRDWKRQVLSLPRNSRLCLAILLLSSEKLVRCMARKAGVAPRSLRSSTRRSVRPDAQARSNEVLVGATLGGLCPKDLCSDNALACRADEEDGQARPLILSWFKARGSRPKALWL